MADSRLGVNMLNDVERVLGSAGESEDVLESGFTTGSTSS